ncbi:hypothetical protein BDA99DRAFT_517829 [Phascolomyces articulosus]|uniref:Uncharacterized protein n=1 Tax=Phascolomyces articulosus TaxID=60185 RepID=A0AAD5JUW3_9FUNG|nr:hypothetical protein BDA99DRAFT_517829 [Phascolomyces articulosus]
MPNNILSQTLLIFMPLLLLVGTALAADCFCKELPPIYTEDCCIGTHGELRQDFGTHCKFVDYSNLGDFNRCCDSYFGMGRCVLSPR